MWLTLKFPKNEGVVNVLNDYDRDLFMIVWGPTVSALSYVFDKSTDEQIMLATCCLLVWITKKLFKYFHSHSLEFHFVPLHLYLSPFNESNLFIDFKWFRCVALRYHEYMPVLFRSQE